MTGAGFSVAEIERVLPLASPEQKLRAFRLLEARRRLAPAARASVSAEELLRLTNDFPYFCREAWRAMFPLTELVWSWHYDMIAEYLQLVRERRLRRVIFNVPPRTLKSHMITIMWPCWAWATEPSHCFLCASYSRDLATDHSIARRSLISSPWYQSLFGGAFRVSADRNLATQFSNDRGGQMLVTSTGSGAEGRGGDTAILDDPMSNAQALSDQERATANAWITGTLMQRLNNPRTAAIVLIMQRLHELDTTGYVLGQFPGEWEHVVVPLVAEEPRDYVFPVSGRVHRRPGGDVLQPERFPPAVVAEKQLSRLVFAGQYQQRPAPLEGNMVKRSEVRYYGGKDPLTGEPDEPLPAPGLVPNPVFSRTLISVDCSFKDLKTSDFVAIGVVSVRGRKRYVRNVVNARLDLDGTVREILRQRAAYPEATAILVEDKANGPAVVQQLRKSVPGVVEIEPQGGKVSRMFAAAPEWQAGDWRVDRNAAWAEPFVAQLTAFPNAAHDDMVDMATQAAIWLGGNTAAAAWENL